MLRGMREEGEGRGGKVERERGRRSGYVRDMLEGTARAMLCGDLVLSGAGGEGGVDSAPTLEDRDRLQWRGWSGEDLWKNGCGCSGGGGVGRAGPKKHHAAVAAPGGAGAPLYNPTLCYHVGRLYRPFITRPCCLSPCCPPSSVFSPLPVTFSRCSSAIHCPHI